jgi:hypothetical protein
MFAAFFLLLCEASYGKEKIVFLVNTAESDVGGGNIKGSPYILERSEINKLKVLFPGAKVIRIRADSNEAIRKGLDLWMQPNPNDKEVMGLYIHSHGNKMLLGNENGKFSLKLPNDIQNTFQPIVGRFSENARIIFSGCLLMAGQSSEQVNSSMRSISESFNLKSGLIYANETEGWLMFQALTYIDIYEKEKVPKDLRDMKVIASALWPVTYPMIGYFENVRYNQGYILSLDSENSRLYKSDYFSALKPGSVVSERQKPLLTTPIQKVSSPGPRSATMPTAPGESRDEGGAR